MMAIIINLSRIFITGYLLFRHIVSNQFNILAGKPLFFKFYDSSTKRTGLLSFRISMPLPVLYAILVRIPAEKKTIEPCPKHNRKCNGFNGYNGNCIGFNGNYNGVYWYVMDSIGGC